MPKQPASKKESKVSELNLLFNIIVPFGVILLLMLATNNLHIYLNRQDVLGSSVEIQEAQPEIAFWEVFLQNNDQYYVGWLELAQLYMNEGKIDEAQMALYKAEEINPNSIEVMRLKKLFN